MLVLNGLTRPLSATTQVLNPTITAGTVVAVDVVDGEESFLLPITYPSTNPPPFDVANCSAANGVVTLSTTSTFANVRVGDVVSGTGITVSSTVTAKASNNLSLTLSDVTTGAVSGLVTFDPPASAPLLHAIKLTYTKSGSTVAIVPQILVYDGTGAPPVVTNLSKQGGGSITQDIDLFLTNFRLPKS